MAAKWWPIEHVFVGGDVIETVVMAHGGGRPRRVELHDIPGDEERIVAIGDQVDGDGRDHDPEGVDVFAASAADDREGDRAEQAKQYEQAWSRMSAMTSPWPSLYRAAVD